MDDKIKEVMGLVRKMGDADFWAGSFAARGDKEGELSKVAESSNLERAIESKLRELVPVWQPIETAPKDGPRILAWNSEYGARETKSETYREGSIGFSEGRTDRWWEWLEPQNNWSLKWSPTHWMPLQPRKRKLNDFL